MSDQANEGKVGKQFEENLKKLFAVLNDPQGVEGAMLLKKTAKVPNDTLGQIVSGLVQEEQETAVKEFTVKFKALLGEVKDYNKFKEEKQREFDKAVEERQKALNGKFNELWAKLESGLNIAKDTEKAVRTVLGANAEAGGEVQNES